ncbi:MAG TPA: hypothetical protein VEJ63_13145 [Planctomycetota bacterium]|nr:hypothetical protein [Planctomycetota bacterium]
MRMTPHSARFSPATLIHESWVLVAALFLPLVFAYYWGAGATGLVGNATDGLFAARPVMQVPAIPDRSAVKPMVAPADWRQMQLLAPDIIQQATVPEYRFINTGTIPTLRVEGEAFNFTLPPALWVKLEHPGQAFMYMDTDAGLFMKPLDEATPGFVSRCSLGRQGYVNSDGEAVELRTDALKVHALWIVQDAATERGHSPGWISLAPPADEPEPTLIAQNSK